MEDHRCGQVFWEPMVPGSNSGCCRSGQEFRHDHCDEKEIVLYDRMAILALAHTSKKGGNFGAGCCVGVH